MGARCRRERRVRWVVMTGAKGGRGREAAGQVARSYATSAQKTSVIILLVARAYDVKISSQPGSGNLGKSDSRRILDYALGWNTRGGVRRVEKWDEAWEKGLTQLIATSPTQEKTVNHTSMPLGFLINWPCSQSFVEEYTSAWSKMLNEGRGSNHSTGMTK